MPDPVLFIQAVAASGAVSAVIVAVLTLLRRPASAARFNAACILGIALGAVVGYRVLKLAPHWPPVDGLDRFMIVVLPAAVIVELIAGIARLPRALAWALRVGLAAVAGRVLLHGSSYLDGSSSDWTVGQTWIALFLCAVMLTAVWGLLAWLAARSPGVSIPGAVSQTCVAAGMALMLSGYLTGGKAALPLAAGVAAAAMTLHLVAARAAGPGAIGIGVVSLFCILFLGRFFGELSTSRAVVIFVAPLLSWVSEMPKLRARKPWLVAAVRLALVALPLVAVLFLAQRDFAKNSTGPGGADSENYEY
ncbi:MAG TPA: hypothetical protein VGH74_19475 [Planctomycetaceae bacterium]|jgi:hypothetical protein